MKKIIGLMMGLGLAVAANADIIAGYDFTSLDATTSDVNLTASAVDSGSGFDIVLVDSVGDNSGEDNDGVVFGATTGGALNASVVNFTKATFEDAVTANEYFTFTVTPGSGYELDLTSISFKSAMKSGNSVDEWAVADSSGTQIGSTWQNPGTSALTSTYNGTTIYFDADTFQNITTATEFRIYGFGRGTANTNNTLATFDQLVLNGSVVAIPEPATIGMLGLGTVGLLAFRRRMR